MPVTIAEEPVTAGNLDALAELLVDCVEGGASVSFMAPFAAAEALAFWQGVGRDVASGAAHLFVARDEARRVVGAVQLRPVATPNQPHRADVSKLLVHRDARRQGAARELMRALEARAVELGRWVLVLDTARGSNAEPLYMALGWTRVGEIPWFALMPDGKPCTTVVFYKHLKALPGGPAGA